jgi:hypothetical protein
MRTSWSSLSESRRNSIDSNAQIGGNHMKTCSIIGSVVILLFAIMTPQLPAEGPAPAQKGQVSADLLSQFGLGGLQRVSDEKGKQVRGKSFMFGAPQLGYFMTDVNFHALLHNPKADTMSGQVFHDLTSHTTTITFQPQGLKVTGK